MKRVATFLVTALYAATAFAQEADEEKGWLDELWDYIGELWDYIGEWALGLIMDPLKEGWREHVNPHITLLHPTEMGGVIAFGMLAYILMRIPNNWKTRELIVIGLLSFPFMYPLRYYGCEWIGWPMLGIAMVFMTPTWLIKFLKRFISPLGNAWDKIQIGWFKPLWALPPKLPTGIRQCRACGGEGLMPPEYDACCICGAEGDAGLRLCNECGKRGLMPPEYDACCICGAEGDPS